jgi:hypothetical protein
MAALSAVRCNVAVRPLYARVVTKHPQQKAIAIGHAMRKLLQLAFAVWKSGQPFAPDHYPWQAPAHVDDPDNAMSQARETSDSGMSQEGQAAGHKPDEMPAQPVVRAACSDTVAEAAAVGEGTYLDSAHLKRQLPLARALEQLGLTPRLRGSGPQRRCPCPLHRGDARGRTFSVNLDTGVWQCFAKECGRKGGVIDLWAAMQGLSLRAAALELVQTFGLEPAPAVEQRRGTVENGYRGQQSGPAVRTVRSARRAGEPCSPTVITETGLDICRYICNGWFGFLYPPCPVMLHHVTGQATYEAAPVCSRAQAARHQHGSAVTHPP